jgi:uncharacterized protein
MLRVDVRQIDRDGIPTRGRLLPDDPAFEGLTTPFLEPVEVEGHLRPTSEGDFVWRGHVRAVMGGECRRCLVAVKQVIDDQVEVVLSANPELLDDPSVYPVPVHAVAIDVAEVVREEVALRASAFPLCRDACRGLCPRCGADLNAGPCRCAAPDSTN